MIYCGNFVEPNVAKVGVEGSVPFARSNDFNALGDSAFVAQGGLAVCVFMSVLMERTYKNPEKSVLKPALNGAWPVYAIGTALIRNALGLVRAVPNLFIVPLSGPEEHMPHVPKQLRHI